MKIYRPDYKLYAYLTLLSIALRLVPFTSGNGVIDSVINDIATGAVASTIVAFLIDKADCNRKNKEKRTERFHTYLFLNQLIMYLLQTYADVCKACFKNVDYSKQEKTWIEWFIICKQKINDGGNEHKEDRYSHLVLHWRLNSKQVVAELDNLINNKHILKLENVMDQNRCFALMQLREILTTDVNLTSSESDCDFSMFEAINKDIEKWISTKSDMPSFNIMKFAPYELWENEIKLLAVLNA
jgi:hypothetical protein